MSRADIAIIGTGPAGISAAITAKVRNKNIVLYGSRDLSQKMQAAEEILNYPGLPRTSGKAMAAAFEAQLKDLGIEITEKRVTSVYAMGDYFALQLSDNTMAEASSVILATGVVAGHPYPGEEQFLGRGVSYCATCDAPLYKGKDVTVIASSPAEEAEADYLAEVCGHVRYLPLYREQPKFTHAGIEVIREKPVEITGTTRVEALKTEQNSYPTSCVFILREAQFPAQLVPGIETDGTAVKADLQMCTNLPGAFVAGDLAGQPYQYIKSAGQGNVAAISAVSYLARQARKNL